jgi:hypothetical protein
MYWIWTSKLSHLMFIFDVVLAFGRHCPGLLTSPLASLPWSFVSFYALSLPLSRLCLGSFPFSLAGSTMLGGAEVPVGSAMVVVFLHCPIDLPYHYLLPTPRVLLSFSPFKNPSSNSPSHPSSLAHKTIIS